MTPSISTAWTPPTWVTALAGVILALYLIVKVGGPLLSMVGVYQSQRGLLRAMGEVERKHRPKAKKPFARSGDIIKDRPPSPETIKVLDFIKRF